MFIQSNESGKWEGYSEKELWKEYRSGNKDAFSALFLRCYSRLFRYGMQFSPNREVVSDGIQTLFLRLWEKRKKVASPQSVYGYLYVSLRRILLRRSKRKKARDQRHINFMKPASPYMHSIEEVLAGQEEKQERRALLRSTLQQLTPRQKEALLLRIDGGMSNSEIADIMGVSDKRVRNLIYQATKKLKEKISQAVD